MTSVGETLYFVGGPTDNGGRRALWKSDGQTVTKVTDTPQQDDNSQPEHLIDVNGRLYFTAHDSSGDRELWTSDGSSAGTRRVANIASVGSSNPNNLFSFDGKLYFTADDGEHGRELWTTDGTEFGTHPVKDVGLSANAQLAYFTVVGNRIYFAVQDGQKHGLWISDGTDTGTYPLRQGDTADEFSAFHLADANGVLYFAGHDEEHGSELWTSDGTAEGTQLVADIVPGPQSSYPHNLVFLVARHQLFFVADDGAIGEEPWVLNVNLPGDTDGNGYVDLVDYHRWLDHCLLPGPHSPANGDFNDDGVVDGADYTMWADNYSLAVESTNAVESSVPG